MTDDLDPVLRARLDRLARAVPVPPERAMRPVVSVAPRWRGGSSGSGLGVLVAAALALAVIFAASFAGSSPKPSAISDSIAAGDFRLSIESPKDRYAAQEPIQVVATLEYLGENPSIKVYSHPGMPGFGVEQIDGPNGSAGPAYRSSCVTYDFRRGEPVTFPFAKSGGFDPASADSAFMREYLNITDGRPDPVLRLPAGTWRIFARADFSLGDCGATHFDQEVGITIVVGPSEASQDPSSDASPSAALPSLVPTPSPSPVASPTLPPPGLAVPYPDGCAAYGLSERRCEYIVEWAKRGAGIAPSDPVTVELLGDPDCPTGPAMSCGIARTMAFVVRVRLTTPAGASDHPVFCGPGGEATLLCTDEPRIQIRSPMNGYHDVPCSGEAPEGCATPVPTIDPAVAAGAVPLTVPTLDIPIDRVGVYSIPLGEAVLPNGILSEAKFGLVDDTPDDVLVEPEGMVLTITSLDDGRTFDNSYRQGWHAGTERVQVTLTFTIEWFEPGAVLHVTGIDVH